jgi:PBP1b-binding outer membrane lipoprotein LpoB
MKLIWPPLFAALLLAGCNSVSSPPEVAVNAAAPGSLQVTPQDFKLPDGGDCTSDIARYRAIQDNDLSMGHVAQSVYNKIKTEIAAAEAECNEGHEAHARAMIVASKQKHGYPTGL